MNEPLRPLTLGEILDRTAQIYRSRFLVFFGIATLPTGILLLFAAGFFLAFLWFAATGAKTLNNLQVGVLVIVSAAVVLLIVLPIYLLAMALGTAAMNHAVAETHLGNTITIRSAYKAVWPRLWRYIGLHLLQSLAVWGVAFAAYIGFLIVIGILTTVSGGEGLGGFSVFLVILAIAGLLYYCIWMSLKLCLAFPACVVEQSGIWASIKRGNALVPGTKGRILLLYLLVWVLGRILAMAVIVPSTFLIALLPMMKNPLYAQTGGVVFLFIVYGSSFAMQALTAPVTGIALMLFYYDQRIRKEGYDIEWMMQKAGLVVPEPAAQAQPAEPWLSADTHFEPPPASPAPQQKAAEASAASLLENLPEPAPEKAAGESI